MLEMELDCGLEVFFDDVFVKGYYQLRKGIGGARDTGFRPDHQRWKEKRGSTLDHDKIFIFTLDGHHEADKEDEIKAAILHSFEAHFGQLDHKPGRDRISHIFWKIIDE